MKKYKKKYKSVTLKVSCEDCDFVLEFLNNVLELYFEIVGEVE